MPNDFPPIKLGKTPDEERVILSRSTPGSPVRHGLVFYDTNHTASANNTLQDIAQRITYTKHSNSEVKIVAFDPLKRLSKPFRERSVSHASVELTTANIANLLTFRPTDRLQSPIESNIAHITATLLTLLSHHGVSVTYPQEELFREIVADAIRRIDGPKHRSELSGALLPLEALLVELYRLCQTSSQQELKEVGALLEELQSSTLDISPRQFTPPLDTQIHHYTFSDNVVEPWQYQALLSSLVLTYQTDPRPTYFVALSLDNLLNDSLSKDGLYTALQDASAANISYDFIIPDYTSNCETTPPIHNWYNDGAYAQYYTPDAVSINGAHPSKHSDWLSRTEQLSPTTRSLVTFPQEKTTKRVLNKH